MKATLSNHRQSPRKVRLVADAIRGKSVERAQQTLAFMSKAAALPMKKLLDSAVANARVSGASGEELFVKTITVDKGMMQKRYRPFARGRSGTIRKTMSHVKIELARMAARPGTAAPAKKPVAAKAASKKPAKKPAAKK